MDVRERHVAGLEHEGRGARRHPLVGPMGDDSAEDTAFDRDQPLGLEYAQCFAQGWAGDPEAFHQVRLVAERFSLRKIALDDELSKLVGNALGLFAQRRSVAIPCFSRLGHHDRPSLPRPLPVADMDLMCRVVHPLLCLDGPLWLDTARWTSFCG
ncbi:hypothetical protein FRAHR75_170069 [Frankia sp. Hr75.2]|nr:hypothetical protein FRAHR75_170069 [Frankia sp. Hr75.2]